MAVLYASRIPDADMKLKQKRFLKGRREFEILEDSLQVRISTLGKDQTLTLSLAVLNPEPVSNPPFLEFLGRVNNEPMVSLFIDTPDAATCREFAETLSQAIHRAYSDYTGIRSGQGGGASAANSYDEPPEFGEAGSRPVSTAQKPVSVASLEHTLEMLGQYLGDEDLDDLIKALETLKTEPDNPRHMDGLVAAFEALGPRQGAVLTYAPYIGLLLSDDPFSF